MKKKHKCIKNIIAILSVFALLMSGSFYSVAADVKGMDDISEYMKQTTDLEELVPGASNYSAKNAIDETTIPAFLILITNGDESIVTSAFYMRESTYTGNTYLMTSGIVGAFADGSYDLYLIRGNYSEKITDVEMDSNNVFAFLTANGVEQFEPMEMTPDVSEARLALAWLAMDSNQNFYMDFEELNMNEWKSSGGAYTGAGKLSDMVLLGAPVIDLNTMNVWGMMYATGELEPVIIDLNYVDMPEEAAITTGQDTGWKPAVDKEESQSEAEPAANEEEEQTEAQPVQETENDTTKWVGIVAIAVAAFALFKKKQTKKEETINQPAEDDEYKEGTIPLYTQNNDSKTQPINGAAVPFYQIRGTGGVFKGQIFKVKEPLKIGRSQECQIQYPAKTGGISGIHCQIEAEAEGVILRDLNSTYGTFYRGRKMQSQIEYHLKVGDSFYLGEETQSFRVEQVGEYRQEFTPTVKAVSKPEAGMIYHADAERKIVFGRSQNAQVRFAENAVPISTKHCVLYRDDSGLYLMDTGSTNGTFLSETLRLKPNVPYRMEKGSAFFLASPKYTFVITEE